MRHVSVLGCSVLGCVLGSAIFVGAHAQGAAADTPDEVYGDGAIPLPPAEFAKLPKTPPYRAYLPARVDLSKSFPRPGNQGAMGSCTAWAVGYSARGYYAAAAEGRNVDNAANIPSPSYIFGLITHDPQKCAGSSIVDALNLLQSGGAMSIKAYPYRSRACPAPTKAQRSQASDFKIGNWLAVDFTDTDQIKGELAKGHPVIVSIRDTKAFHQLRGPAVFSASDSAQVGWHALVVVGYDESKRAFRVINSWGERWGDHGFGWIAYSVAPALMREAYVMRPLAPVPDPAPVVAVNPKPAPPPSPGADKPPAPVRPVPLLVGGCSKLSAMESGHGMPAKLMGFTGSKTELSQAQPQADISHVQERPWPQCEVLETLGDRLAGSRHPAVEVVAEDDRAKGSTLLKFKVRTPDYPSFLHVAYLQADGSVLNLVQPSSMTLHAYPPNSSVILGDGAAGGPLFHVSPPFGREMLVVVASRSPLFDAPLPDTQSAREFLTKLRQALVARPDATSPDRLVTAGFDSVVTSEKGVVAVPPPSGM